MEFFCHSLTKIWEFCAPKVEIFFGNFLVPKWDFFDPNPKILKEKIWIFFLWLFFWNKTGKLWSLTAGKIFLPFFRAKIGNSDPKIGGFCPKKLLAFFFFLLNKFGFLRAKDGTFPKLAVFHPESPLSPPGRSGVAPLLPGTSPGIGSQSRSRSRFPQQPQQPQRPARRRQRPRRAQGGGAAGAPWWRTEEKRPGSSRGSGMA